MIKKLFMMIAVLGLAAPVMAAQWRFYGTARMWTGIKDVDKETRAVKHAGRLLTMEPDGKLTSDNVSDC